MNAQSEIKITTCKGCKRKFPIVYTKCPYCHIKNPDKPPAETKPAGPKPEPKCACLDPLHPGDNLSCPVHSGGQP